MWVENIDRTTFLKELYFQAPSADMIRILNTTVFPNECKLCISIAILQLPDNLPEKWKNKNGNAVKVEISFWAVHNAEVVLNNDSICTEFSINKEDGGNLRILIDGQCTIKAYAEAGAVSNIDAIIY